MLLPLFKRFTLADINPKLSNRRRWPWNIKTGIIYCHSYR